MNVTKEQANKANQATLKTWTEQEINNIYVEGQEPLLHYYFYYFNNGSSKKFIQLLKLGWDVNKKDKDGSPLVHKQVTIFPDKYIDSDLLFLYGYDFMARNAKGKTVFDIDPGGHGLGGGSSCNAVGGIKSTLKAFIPDKRIEPFTVSKFEKYREYSNIKYHMTEGIFKDDTDIVPCVLSVLDKIMEPYLMYSLAAEFGHYYYHLELQSGKKTSYHFTQCFAYDADIVIKYDFVTVFEVVPRLKDIFYNTLEDLGYECVKMTKEACWLCKR